MEKSDIDALISTPVSETRTIDYKESLGDLNSEEGKLKLLRDVASFANTAGGTIYFGISELRDAKNEQTGVPDAALGLAGFNLDFEVKRIESTLATGIEPRVSITLEVIDGFQRGPILALRIPQSWAGPHMARDGRFYARDNAGRKPMDYHMIRNSFISLLSLNEEVRSFQRERVKAIFENRTPLPLEPGARLVMHALPISAFIPATRRLIPIGELAKQADKVCFRDVYRGRANLEGWLIPHKSEGGTKEYIQLFRTGIMERVHTGFTLEERGEHVVIGNDIMEILTKGIRGFLNAQRSLGIEPPVVVMIAVKGVAGHRLVHSEASYYGVIASRTFPGGFDRDEFALPEMYCEALDSPNDDLIRELLAILWQASGSVENPPDIKSG